VFVILGSSVIQCEILRFFSPLSEFWNQRKIRIVEILWIVTHVVCHVEGYLQLVFLGQKIPETIPRPLLLFQNGITVFSVLASIWSTWLSIYIISLVFRHFMISKKNALARKTPQMKVFVVTVAFGSLLDWLGISTFITIGLFSDESRSIITLAVCCMYIHAIGMAYIFYQLKFISVTQETIKTVPKKSILLLKDLVVHEQTRNSGKELRGS
jgi:hypothetical protein